MSNSVRLVLDDGTYELDLTTFMLSEGMALEKEWGLTVTEFSSLVTSGNPPLAAIGAMVWLVKARTLAAATGVSFREAARQMPVAEFDTNLTAIRIEEAVEPENPTPGGTRTKGTRTTRTTSGAKRAKSA